MTDISLNKKQIDDKKILSIISEIYENVYQQKDFEEYLPSIQGEIGFPTAKKYPFANKTAFHMYPKKAGEQIEKLTELVPVKQIYYAMKANSRHEILQEVAKKNAGCDCASVKEVQDALNYFDPKNILFSNPLCTREEIEQIIGLGVRKFVIHSEEYLEIFPQECCILLRIATNPDTSRWSLGNKFGCDKKSTLNILKKLCKKSFSKIGISFHVGSQNEHPDSWKEALEKANQLQKKFPKINVVDLGGGFPISYDNQISETFIPEVKQLVEEYISKETTIIIEPGRFIAAPTTILQAQVKSIRTFNDTKWIYLDVGIYQGMFEAVGNLKFTPLSTKTGVVEEVILAGPTCDGIDVISKKIKIPQTTSAGDFVIFENAGAYSIESRTQFNGFNSPEVIVHE